MLTGGRRGAGQVGREIVDRVEESIGSSLRGFHVELGVGAAAG